MSNEMNPYNDYVECLVAAGWVRMEDIDEEYLRYKKSEAYAECGMSWESWKATKDQLEALQERIWELDAKLGPTTWTNEHDKQIKPLISESAYLEWCLGY